MDLLFADVNGLPADNAKTESARHDYCASRENRKRKKPPLLSRKRGFISKLSTASCAPRQTAGNALAGGFILRLQNNVEQPIRGELSLFVEHHAVMSTLGLWRRKNIKGQ
jgi:hypothetical protein